jgi:hypothetical protein
MGPAVRAVPAHPCGVESPRRQPGHRATTSAIAVANTVAEPAALGDALAATIASCAAALVRFSLLRGWAFRPLASGPALSVARR